MSTKKTISILCLFAFFLYPIFHILYPTLAAQAFEATSASFELHAGDLESTVASSTSATFQLRNAGGQLATASSSVNNTSVSSGILYWLFSWFNNRYDQIHYRWRDDNGSETTATFPVYLDNPHVIFPKNTNKRLRFEVSNEGWTRSVSPTFRIETAELSSGSDCANGPFAVGYTAVPTTYGSSWVIATSTNITDPEATLVGTNDGIPAENRTFVSGQLRDASNTTAGITIDSSSFTKVEFSLLATDLATNGATYCFRLTNAGATSGVGYSFGYSKYAMAQLQSALAPTGYLDSAVFDTYDGGGTGLGAAYNSIMWNGTVEGTGKVRFQFATSDSSSGPWNFYGSSDNGATCNNTSYYDTNTSGFGGGPGKPVEISCAPTYHNNQRYFRYRVQICSADCTSGGLVSPIVTGVVVNWAP